MSLSVVMYLVGSGSLTLGVEAAGFNVEYIYETPGYAKNARTWQLNRPDVPIDVLELDAQNDTFKHHRGLDLICGNPPCGGVSAMTCSRINSPTNECMRKWVRMVVRARPRMILMENGYQLATKRMSSLLGDLTSVLETCGYCWWTWMFYSYQVGTPQIRRRMFLCASLDRPRRHDLFELDDLPPPGVKSSCPCGPFLEDLIGVKPSPEPVIVNGKVIAQHYYDRADGRYEEINRLIGLHRDKISSKTLISTGLLERVRKRADEGHELSLKMLPAYESKHWPNMPKQFDGMSMSRPQVIYLDRAAPAMIGFYKFVHPVDDRLLTMREMARLMGYPDWWQFHQLKPHLLAQGVPVANAKWSAERLKQVIDLRG
jgi:DNA (cytosine-5)-methyltransferase 1